MTHDSIEKKIDHLRGRTLTEIEKERSRLYGDLLNAQENYFKSIDASNKAASVYKMEAVGEERARTYTCPFLKEKCIGRECALFFTASPDFENQTSPNIGGCAINSLGKLVILRKVRDILDEIATKNTPDSTSSS